MADFSVSQVLTWIIGVPLVLLFLYFFAARCERDKEKEQRQFDAKAELYFNGTQKSPVRPRQITRKKPSDPMLVFGYWVLLPLLFSSVTIIAIMLLGSLVN